MDKISGSGPKKGFGRVTLADVAHRVGTSTITVSRALRRPEMVSETLRSRITAAVSELGYLPDPAARALASRRSDVIGVLIPSIANIVFADLLTGLYDTVAPTRYFAQLGNTRYSSTVEEELIGIFLSQRPAGLIIAGIDQSARARKLLASADCPIVQIMETTSDPIDMVVGLSHRDAARAATEHLLAQGYKAPAFLGARMDPRSQRRQLGFRDALTHADLPWTDRELTTPTPSSVRLGGELFDQQLAQHPDTDAVFCNNDDLALGAQFAAQRAGLRIGQDIGICGFNDLEVMASAYPAITSVRTNRRQMGEIAARLIIDRIEDRHVPPNTVDLGWSLAPRASTRRA